MERTDEVKLSFESLLDVKSASVLHHDDRTPYDPHSTTAMSTPAGTQEQQHQLPSYLTESLIKRSLEHDLQRPVTIDRFTAGPATAAGDNYLSDVFWIRVEYDGGASEKRLLAKCMPDIGDRGATLDVLDAFRKESETFQHLLPEFSRLVSTDGREQFGAKCYYATTEPVRTIVFEDLKALGYRMCDRTQGGLDYEHMMLVMRKIATFHAASMLYAGQSAEHQHRLASRYAYGLHNPQEQPADCRILQALQKGLTKFISVASDWTELEGEVLRKLEVLLPVFKERIADCVKPRQPGARYEVLNHGDLWSNNMMFRYDDGGTGAVREIMFVDYQISNYGSPGLDLVYTLYNCPHRDVRLERREELLTEYHRVLGETLRRNRYEPVPTFDDVKEEFTRNEFFGLVCAITFLPIMTMERSKDLDLSFDAFFKEGHGERLRDKQYNGTVFRQAVVPILHDLHARGYVR
uniref:CHK domain-containing protein n=1 Tax=Anopheles christyi TaxID=43041 RepID=A0A182KBV4_9DIPT